MCLKLRKIFHDVYIILLISLELNITVKETASCSGRFPEVSDKNY